MGLFSNKAEKKRAKTAAAQQEVLGAYALETADAERARKQAAEESRFNVYTMLGAPGTYGPEAAAGGGTTTSTGGTGTSAGIFDTNAQKTPLAGSLINYGKRMPGAVAAATQGTREGILNPSGYANEISKSASFRIQSQLVGEAEQLLNRQGPAWDRLYNSTIGQIYEGAALQNRDTLRQLRNNLAKGGTVRKDALNQAQQMLSNERALQARTQQTWQANLQLDNFVRNNAAAVQQGTGSFLDNLPGIRDAYQNAMENSARLSLAATQYASIAFDQAYQDRAAVQDTDWWGMLFSAGVSIVGGALGFGSGTGVSNVYNSIKSVAQAPKYSNLGFSTTDILKGVPSKVGGDLNQLINTNTEGIF